MKIEVDRSAYTRTVFGKTDLDHHTEGKIEVDYGVFHKILNDVIFTDEGSKSYTNSLGDSVQQVWISGCGESLAYSCCYSEGEVEYWLDPKLLAPCAVPEPTVQVSGHEIPYSPAVDYTKSFPNMVRRLVKSGEQILNELTVEQADLWHVATGVSGEAGELLDAVKKHVVYQKPLDRDNVIEELGDIEFYLERVRQIIGVERHETLTRNIDKLAIRYPDFSFSNQSAIERADKL